MELPSTPAVEVQKEDGVGRLQVQTPHQAWERQRGWDIPDGRKGVVQVSTVRWQTKAGSSKARQFNPRQPTMSHQQLLVSRWRNGEVHRVPGAGSVPGWD